MADALTVFQVSVLPLGGPPARAVINDEDVGEFLLRPLNHMRFRRQEKYGAAVGAKQDVALSPRGSPLISPECTPDFFPSHGTNIFCTFLNTSAETKTRLWRNT
jgi:hypothetical protein